MRIAIIGTGGIGAPLGASLARAGQDVVFVASGAHLEAMRANGLRVEGDRGETVIRPAEVTDDPSSLGPVDLVLFCVKLWDVEKAGNHIRPLIGGDTVVIPLQNGIDASERLVPILGAAHVLGGVALVSGSIVAPGVIRQTGTHHGMVFGEVDGQATARAERIHAVCRGAGIDAVLTGDIENARWQKFIGLVAVSGLCALTRRPIGDVRDDPDLGPLLDDLMREVLDVGRACGGSRRHRSLSIVGMAASRTSRGRYPRGLRRNPSCPALSLDASREDRPKRRSRPRRDDAARPLPAGTRQITGGAVDAHNACRADAARFGTAAN